MILRVFRVRGPEGQDAAVLRFVEEVLGQTGADDHRPVAIEVARRLVGRSVEVVVVSKWRSWDDIQAWTGPDGTRPLDRELPEMFDIRIEHFESVEPGGDGRRRGSRQGRCPPRGGPQHLTAMDR